jgi:hypothetical protein
MNANPTIAKVDVEITQNDIPTMAEYQKGERIKAHMIYRTTFDIPN